MTISKLTKLVSLCSLSLTSLTAFAGEGWNVKFVNTSDKDIVLSQKANWCFYLSDFENPVVVKAHSSLKTYAEEKNSGSCHAGFYRIHQLDLWATIDHGTSAEKSHSISFVGDFSNRPGAHPKVILSAKDNLDNVIFEDTWKGLISASSSTVSGIVIFDKNSKPFYGLVRSQKNGTL